MTADVDFGASFGLKSLYYKSRGTVAGAGILRLANAENVAWRNAANDADVTFGVNASNNWNFNGTTVSPAVIGYLTTIASNVQDQLDAKATSSSLSSHTSANTAHGVSGNIVGTSGSQTLSSKTLNNTTFTGSISGISALTGVTLTTYTLNGGQLAASTEMSVLGTIGFRSSGALELFNTANTFHVTLQGNGSMTADWTLTLPVNDGTSGQVLTTDGSGNTSWGTAGSGDVSTSSAFGTDNRLIRSDGTAKVVQSSGITIDDSDNVTGMASLALGTTAGGVRLRSRGTGNTSSSFAFLAENSDGNAIISARDDRNVGIGISNPTSDLHVHGSGTQNITAESTDGVAQLELKSANTSDTVFEWWSGTREGVMGIDQSATEFKMIYVNAGTVSFGTSVGVKLTSSATSWTSNSDYRLKKDFTPFKNALAILSNWRAGEFIWKENGLRDIGLIAQDVQKTCPHIVSKEADTGLLGMQYSKVTAVLVKAVQELKEEIDTLRASLSKGKESYGQ